MKRLAALLLLLLSALAPAFARNVVDTVRIGVALQSNGDAVVSELWNIKVDDEITEWYRVVDNLGRMDIRNLNVEDETGAEYVNEGEWDVNRSRSAKALRCGLVTKSDGYEICWGVGSGGWHTYRATYELTGLVQSHSDLDGFNYMFVSRGQGSPPDYIEVRIHKADTSFSYENSKIWGFGFKGDVVFDSGEIVARTSEPFTEKSGLIVLAGFDKGLFSPSIEDDDLTFDQMRERALEGGDYKEPKRSFGATLLNILIWLFFVGVFLLFAVVAVVNMIKLSRRRKELFGGAKKDIPWFRGVPLNGDLFNAYGVLKTMDRSPEDQKNLISAYMTRLFYRKAFVLVPGPEGKPEVKVMDFPIDPQKELTADEKLEKELFGFFKEAAGDDGVLQKKELKKWMNRNGERAYNWRQGLQSGVSVWSLQPKDVQEVFGLKKFLKDFTLIEDRGVVEVGLWNNYLVFASLFGIADQVRKDFNKVCPEYFQLSQIGDSLNGAGAVVAWDMINYTSRDFNYAAANYASHLSSGSGGSSWSGGGGGASFGGGGGFSGGGFGGGGR